jgi:hypothetical protein
MIRFYLLKLVRPVGADAEYRLQENFMVDPAVHIRLIVVILKPEKCELGKVIVHHGRSPPGSAAKILFCSAEVVIIFKKTECIVSRSNLPSIPQIHALDIKTILVSLKALH